MQIRPHYPCIHTRSCAHQIVVVVPVHADCLKTPNINKKYRKQRYKRREGSISSARILRTVIVIMIAITPSLNASSLAVFITYTVAGNQPACRQLRMRFETALCRHPISRIMRIFRTSVSKTTVFAAQAFSYVKEPLASAFDHGFHQAGSSQALKVLSEVGLRHSVELD